jgi:hypothetical protein
MILFEDEDMLIIPNKNGPSNDRYGLSAAMSYVHLIALPKRRIYNAVTLTKTDIEVCSKPISPLGFTRHN